MIDLHIKSEGDIEDGLEIVEKILLASNPNSEFERTVNITVKVPTMFWAQQFAEDLNELVSSMVEEIHDPDNLIGVNVMIKHYGKDT